VMDWGDVIANADAGGRQGGRSFGLPNRVHERRSEAETLKRLERDHKARIKRVARDILKDRRDEGEAVNDTFLKAHENWSEYRGEASEQTWLRTICCNVCIDKLRMRRRAPDCSPLDPNQEPPAAAVEADLRLALWQEIDHLPDDRRAAFTLRLAGFTFNQIAELLDKPRTTVIGHYNAACKRLRKRLYPPSDEPPTEGS